MKKIFHITVSDINAFEQVLAIKVGDRHCCFAITNITGEKLGQLSYYTTEEINESLFVNLFVNHPELNNSFNKVIVCYDFPQAVLIPKQYFAAEEACTILKTLYGFNNHSIVATQSIPTEELYIVYAVPPDVSEWLNKKFISPNFFHYYSVPIQNNNSGESFWIDFRTDEFSLFAIKEKKLLLVQTFSYSNPDDVIYYLLKTAQQFSFSSKEVKLFLSGLIEKDSALFKELFRYFLNLEFRNTYWQIDNNEYPDHFFTSLKDLIQCAS